MSRLHGSISTCHTSCLARASRKAGQWPGYDRPSEQRHVSPFHMAQICAIPGCLGWSSRGAEHGLVMDTPGRASESSSVHSHGSTRQSIAFMSRGFVSRQRCNDRFQCQTFSMWVPICSKKKGRSLAPIRMPLSQVYMEPQYLRGGSMLALQTCWRCLNSRRVASEHANIR